MTEHGGNSDLMVIDGVFGLVHGGIWCWGNICGFKSRFSLSKIGCQGVYPLFEALEDLVSFDFNFNYNFILDLLEILVAILFSVLLIAWCY